LLDRDEDLSNALLREQEQLLDNVEAAHLAMGTQINLQALPRIGQRAAEGPGGPFPIRVDFTDIVGKQVGVLPHGILDVVVSRRLERTPRDYLAMFFGACVAYRCALWHAARQYIHRALSYLPTDSHTEYLRHEMQHLLTVAIRYSMTKAEEFNQANDIHTKAANYFNGTDDALGEARALTGGRATRLPIHQAVSLEQLATQGT
jgi:hypothetical protein